MAELEKERTDLEQHALDPRLYYDYEGRFIKQRLERDHMRVLPRVVKPELFARGGHALGDMRVFERYTAGPVSFLTCRFLELDANATTPRQRRIPSITAYILEGDGTCVQEQQEHAFSAGDVVFVPPYTTCRFVAGAGGLRAWIPEVRLWHVLGLLWQEELEPERLPSPVEAMSDQGDEGDEGDEGDGSHGSQGYRIPSGVLGLEEDLIVAGGQDPRRGAVFEARRAAAANPPPTGDTKYDYFLRLQAEEPRRSDADLRIIPGEGVGWERTRQGRMKFYMTNWTNAVGQSVDLAAYEIEAGGHTGRHRHIAEEILLVLEGSGHDSQDGVEHPWSAGDLVCVPPMTEHQHFNDGAGDARLLTAWIHHPASELLGGIEHIGDASAAERR